MTTARTMLGALLIVACAETPTPKPETAETAASTVAWDEALAEELDAYARAEFAKWLEGRLDAAQDGVADDTALLYEIDHGGNPVRLVGPDAIRKFAASLIAHSNKHVIRGAIEEQTCRATAEAGVCTTVFKLDVPLPDGQTLAIKRRGTCVAARAYEEWRWSHCHMSLAEWPDPSTVKLSSTNGNKDGLQWEKTPAGYEMAPVWRNPLTGQHAAFVRFKVEWGDAERHFHDATSLAAVFEGRMTHWSEGGSMHEAGPGGFALIGGGRDNAHTSEFDEGTIAYALFDKPMNRISTEEAKLAAALEPPSGEAPWNESVVADLEALSRAEMRRWEAMDVDAIAQGQMDVGLPSYELGADGKPVVFNPLAEQIEFAKKIAASGVKGTVDPKKIVCRGTQSFGWCAIDYDYTMDGPDGRPMTMSFRGTGVSARTADGWKSIHWHGSMAQIPGPPPPRLRVVKPEDLVWEDLTSAPGAKVATLWEDPAKGTTAIFLKIEKEWKGMKSHFHSHNMHYAVLKGSYTHIDKDGTKRVTQQGGWGFEAARNVHRTEGAKGTLLFIVTDGPLDSIKVDAQGNPIEKK